jgi:PAS domain S-box-containing protein
MVFLRASEMEGHFRWEARHLRARGRIADLESRIQEAEAMARDGLMPGEAQPRGSFEGICGEIHARLDEVEELTADDPEQRGALGRLRPLLVSSPPSWLPMAPSHGKRDRPAQQAATVVPASRIRELLEGMKSEEDRLLIQHNRTLFEGTRTFRKAILGGTATAVPLLALGFFAFAWGVRERAVAERMLSARRRELDQLIDLNLDLFALIDAEGRLLRLNQAWTETLGCPLSDLPGTSCFDLVHIEDLPAFRRAFAELPQGPAVSEFTCRIMRQDGSLRWLEWRGTILGDQVYAAARDITDRHLGEEANQTLTTELQARNRDLEQFATLASHDLQEPLRMVVAFTGLLARTCEGHLGEEADQYIGFAGDGARRMQCLIDDLLDYSRVGTRGKPLVFTSTGAALALALLNLQGAIQETAAVITQGPLPDLEADPSQLAALFQNLVGNAIKFRGPSPPEIHVAAAPENDRWHFTIKDNGIGIDPDNHARVFEIFKRLHPRSEYPGTGVGLAICKRIVERHHGSIWVASNPDRGTTFHFTLPSRGEP